MHTHDGSFALPRKPPFEAGKGPFHVKGSALVDEVELYRSILSDAQFRAALRGMPDPQAATFVSGSFARTGWYDIVPLLYLTASVAAVRSVTLTQQLHENAAWHAKRAFHGLSGIVLRMTSVETLSLWLPRSAKLFHDFGDVTTTVLAPGRVRAVRTGIPQFFVQIWATIGASFVESSLAVAGAKRSRVYPLDVTEDGVRFSQRTFTIPFDVHWDV